VAGLHHHHPVELKPDDPQIILTEPGIGYRVAESP
jgi:hypothetical protein